MSRIAELTRASKSRCEYRMLWMVAGICWMIAGWSGLMAVPSYGQGLRPPNIPNYQRFQSEPTPTLPSGRPADPVAQQRFDDIMKLLNQKPASGPPPAIKNFQVLSIGVNKYPPGLPQLHGAVNDANDVALTFEEAAHANGGSAVVEKLLDEDATTDAIKGALANLSAQPRTSDCVVVYMAGHGDRSGGVWRFIPHDFNSADPENTSISGAYILDSVKPLLQRGQLVFLVIDACHAGQAFKHMQEYDRIGRFDFKPNGGLTDAKNNAGLVLFAAAVGSQTSREKTDALGQAHGRFTLAFTDAFLTREFDNDDANLTLRDLRDMVIWKMHLLEESQHCDILPGFSVDDQDCVCEYSHFLSDSLAIRALGSDLHRRLERVTDVDLIMKRVSEKGAPARSVADSPNSLVGKWSLSLPLTNSDGTPAINQKGKAITANYTLLFTANGEYAAVLSDGMGGGMSNCGQYTYRRGKTLDLDFGAGVDRLDLFSLSQNTIEIGWTDMQFNEQRAKLHRESLTTEPRSTQR